MGIRYSCEIPFIDFLFRKVRLPFFTTFCNFVLQNIFGPKKSYKHSQILDQIKNT